MANNHGGRRANAGRKKAPKIADPNIQKQQNIAQRGYEELDDILEILLERAKGVKVFVRSKMRGKTADGETVWLAETVEDCKCKSCGAQFNEKELMLVYQEPPNDQQLQFLYNQFMGRAAAKSQEVTIPEINVIFNTDIRCQEGNTKSIFPTSTVEPDPTLENIPQLPKLGLTLPE